MRFALHLFSTITKTVFCTLCFCPLVSSLTAQLSPLAAGSIFKMEILENQLYKLDYNWIGKNTDFNLQTIDPQKIQIWSGLEDLKEIPIQIKGQEDGSFDTEDYILFYAEGGDDHITGFKKNPFSEKNFYFLKVGETDGLRVIPDKRTTETPNTVNTVSRTITIDDDLVNLLEQSNNNSGSGQIWAGPEISNNKSTDIKRYFDFSDAVEGLFNIRAEVWIRSDQTEEVSLVVGNTRVTKNSSPIELGDPEEIYARIISLDQSLTLTATDIDSEKFSIEFNKKSPNAQAWINIIEVNFREELSFSGKTKIIESSSENQKQLSIRSSAKPMVWSYSAATDISELELSQHGSKYSFDVKNASGLIIFDPSQPLVQPESTQKIFNQDLRSLNDIEMVILYPPAFKDEALRLAEHRRSYSGYKVATIDVETVYNEFGSGQKSPEGIRYFAKYLWERNQDFKFLLLFGDGSYDFRALNKNHDDQNFIPTYETKESLDPILSFPTDDYFALLDESDPNSLIGNLDIAVGRLTVRSVAEAEAVVTKIVNYETNNDANGAWKTRITFLADDEDNNLHLNDADRIATQTRSSFPVFNQQKIYWDAFVQESTPGGNRYPDANNKINETIDQGVLVMNYLGHGGPIGWSQERVLHISDIESWSNFNRLPLIITATCSFTGFDDPNITSAGEEALLNPVGGAIALFTTVRSVYASQNFRLTQAVYDTIFTKENGYYLTLGEILQRAKNSNPRDNTNARKFLLIGDPSMRLKLPTQTVRTTELNDKSINEFQLDTVGALSKIHIKGEILDENGDRNSTFNGQVEISVYDKESEIRTLKNDPGSFVKGFQVQNNIIFKGKASVKDGIFEATFTIPIDINYSPGRAKMSYYALDNSGIEAIGYFDQMVIAGTATDIELDQTGPWIQLFLNNTNFKNRGETGPFSTLIVHLRDENGINLSTSSIGHEITAVIDDDTQNTIILNNFFTSNVDQFTSGEIHYSLERLSDGPHQIKVKAYDVANNLGEATLDFTVVSDREYFINLFTPVPNPISNNASFSFLHDLGINTFDVEIHLFNMEGQWIKKHTAKVVTNNDNVGNIIWEGISTKDGLLKNGVYLYTLNISSPLLEKPVKSVFKKLIILK